VRLFLPRGYLEENLKQLEVDYDSVVIPRPKGWFLVVPVEIEFWQGRPNLHDRIRYTSQKDLSWKIDRLSLV
jgi:pyridoxamine 5'-phosphate oxidase